MDKTGIVISRSKFYNGLYLIALLIPFVINSFEINVALSSLFLLFILFESAFKVSKTLLTSIAFLLFIFIISFLPHFFYKNLLYDVIKDSAYLLKPPIYMVLGYYLATKIKDKDYIFKAIIYLGLLLAIMHLFKVFSFLIETKLFQINYIRNEGGKDNFLELLACSLLLLNKNNKYFQISFRFKRIAYILLIVSFVFYFSRTMLVAFFLILLAVNGHTKLTKKSITVIFSVLIGVLIFYRILFSMDIERGALGIKGFLYKLKIAPSEIFDSNINTEDHVQLWDKWRAYEAKKAFDTMAEQESIVPYFTGMGLGSLVDLGFEASLGSERMQYIPKIHNGYVYVFFKTGLIGFILYFFFLINLYLQSYLKPKTKKINFINNLIAAIALFYFFSSFIISGIFNPVDIFSIFLGALLFLQLHFNKIDEDSDIRN